MPICHIARNFQDYTIEIYYSTHSYLPKKSNLQFSVFKTIYGKNVASKAFNINFKKKSSFGILI